MMYSKDNPEPGVTQMNKAENALLSLSPERLAAVTGLNMYQMQDVLRRLPRSRDILGFKVPNAAAETTVWR